MAAAATQSTNPAPSEPPQTAPAASAAPKETASAAAAPAANPVTMWHRFLYEIYAALICSVSAGTTAWFLAPWSGFDVTRWEAAKNIFCAALVLHIMSWLSFVLIPSSWRQ
ncbi:hypothetical protein [Oecophyllibacter saccharovorans]|uniref:Uncharacterized protein n=1 Tax=Oecophyllibacter saccharovorans TaxID=2558360 RepID=A0A506ULR4_9PROT|nr:hypothetical protein [Oecophyllibacter saccharovorans]QDH15437.1 hypothetical protein E3E11_05765 [Oecophyllibacter saccharovorans]TPW34270.1 hypothetical protein E3202_07120 [Oecophyllibacter saccharovorans]TPW36457.1 hypothetical protein E3203_01350 [Oecophyllibacter saccharovorans]